MKVKMKEVLCRRLGFESNKTLTATATFEEESIKMISISDGKRTYHVYSNTPEFAIANALFEINIRIRNPNFTYKIEG